MRGAAETIIVMSLLIIMVVILSGCGHRPTKVITKEVKIEVPVDCVDKSDIPPERTLETDSLNRDDTIFRKAQALSIDFKQLKADNGEFRALIKGCVKK